MTFEREYDVPSWHSSSSIDYISFDFAYLPLLSLLRFEFFLPLIFSLQVENIKPFFLFPFRLLIHRADFYSFASVNAKLSISQWYTVLHNCVARSASIVSFFFNYKAISSQYTSTCPPLKFLNLMSIIFSYSCNWWVNCIHLSNFEKKV
jgi:hypothetical protein